MTDPPGVTPGPASTRIPERFRTWAIATVDGAPASVERLAVKSLLGVSVLTLGIVFVVRPSGVFPVRSEVLAAAAMLAVAFCSAVYLLAGGRFAQRAGAFVGRVIGADTRAAIALALAVWMPLMLIPVYLCAKATEPPAQTWIGFGFMDKRWETSSYLLGILAPMILLVGAARLLDVGRTHPASLRRWFADALVGAPAALVPPPDLRWRVIGSRAAGIAFAVAFAWYLYGPPWHVDRYQGHIDYHEDVHLGGLQAMHDGALPYVGPSAVQYGPGTQLLMYLYMTRIGSFSIVGFRETFAIFHWIAATIFFIVLVLAIGNARAAVAAVAAAVVYPTLQLFGFSGGNAYGGFFGWGNLLRYVGAFALVLLLPGVIRRCPSRRGLAAGFGLGLLWGFLTYVAQENLAGGVIGAVVVVLLLLLSRTASARAVLRALAAVAVGFLVTWVPVAVYYLLHGELGTFVHLYLLLPGLVAEGYSNSPYLEGLHSPWGRMFYVFPFVLAALALLCVLRFRPFRIARDGWSSDRLLLVAATLTTAVIYEGSLLRSDQTHLVGTMLAVPLLGIVAATTLPRVIGARRRATLIGGAALVAGVFAVLIPRTAFATDTMRHYLVAPYHDRHALAAEKGPPEPPTVAGRRIGAGLADAPTCCTGSDVSMPSFIALMNRIHDIVGSRTAFVVDFFDAYPGLIYFAADLKPAPTSVDLSTMVTTSGALATYNADFKTRVLPQIDAMISESFTSTYMEQFLAAHPDARRVKLTYGRKPYYVLLRR